MQENEKRESMKSKLAEELKWYTLYASEEEYDEKAVESILYLLDRWEPLEKGTVPPVEESWKRFLQVAGRKELLPVENAVVKRNPAAEGVAAGQKLSAEAEHTVVREGEVGEGLIAVKKTKGSLAMEKAAEGGEPPVKAAEGGEPPVKAVEGGKPPVKVAEGGEPLVEKTEYGSALCGDTKETMPVGMAESVQQGQADEPENNNAAIIGKHAGRKKAGKLARFAARHKMIVAAVLVLMILMVGNTIHAVANPEVGFFFWMKRDDSGVKMMTSPEGLDSATNDKISRYYNEEDVPEWAKKWVQIETGIEFGTKDAYEFQHIEISESDNRRHVTSYFECENNNKEIYVGVWVYWDKVSYFKEEFLEYDYVDSYEFAQKELEIYKKTESTGKVYYIVCFYDGNGRYYVRGQDILDELKKIAEEYWICVQNNS